MRLLLCVFCSVLFCYASFANLQDSAIVPASNKYEDPPIVKRILVGKNYRDLWSLPVKMELFDITKERGGLTITELGGGFQTKSLRMKDKDSIEWALRTVDKEVKKAVPKWMRKTFAEKIVQDMISAAHPYAPLTVAPLAKAIGVNAPDPKLYFVPDDPAFGKYQDIFANSICMLERTDPTQDNSDAKSTETLFEKLIDKDDNIVDDTTLLKARLLDMLIADWDRHADQWKWGTKKVNDNTVYYPIPRDRDQAFFHSTGLLVKIVRLFALQHFVGFTKDGKRLINLNKKSWSFDQLLLNQLDESDWKRIIGQFQQTLDDSTIAAAVMKLPPEVYNKSGAEILEKLRMRRDGLMEYGMKYYSFISRTVRINGTNEADLYKISNDKGNLLVTRYNPKSQNVSYQRSFSNQQTRIIQLHLLGGEDQVIVEKDVSSKIKISIKGGDGNDTYVSNGNLKIEADK